MGARYSPAALIKLRESPLVCKPTGLPPTEEWMGPPQEQPTQGRRHNDHRNKGEGSFGNEGNVRPSLGETRQSTRGSSNVPPDIVLGPPKTAFASSGLKSPRAFDLPARSAFGNFGSDTPKHDYFGRSKFTGDKDGQTESTKQIRDGDSWGVRRHQEGHHGNRDGNDEGEVRGQRRNERQGDWNNEGRRNGTGREGKQAWSKDEDTFGATKLSKEEKDANIENIRNRTWRDGERGQRKNQDRDYDRNQERNPEWMAADEPAQRKEKHTAQDIEAWKAQMKAQSKGGIVESVSEDPGHTRTASGSLKTKSDKPLTLDKGMDSFFNLWDKPQTAPIEPTQPSEDSMKGQQAKGAGKASRFTGFFGPATPTTPAAPPPPSAPISLMPSQPMPTAEQSALQSYHKVFNETAGGNDDKAGFDRMLHMLRSSAPELPPNESQSRSENARPNPPQSPTIHSPRSQKKHGLEGILGQQSQSEPPRGVINKDTEFLLNLLRKDDGWQQHFPGMNQQKPDNQQNQQHRPTDAQYHDDRQFSVRHGVDKLNPTAMNRRPPQSRQFDHDPQEHSNHPPLDDIPPGVGRPPGFDQHPLPPFAPMNQMGRGIMAPPPGFVNGPGGRGFPPGLGPAMHNLNLGPDRGPPFVGRGGGAPPYTGHPFPPGFNPMMGPGGFPGGNGPPGSNPQGRPPLMDMFGPGMPMENGNQNMGNPSHGPPSGFQRQE